jgi:feruloyl esterase
MRARLGFFCVAVALLPLSAFAAQDFGEDCAAVARPAPPDTHLAASLVTESPSWSPVKETTNPSQPAAAFAAKPFAVSAPFCRIEGTIGTDIGFELWLPEPSRWNGRLLGAGVGGDAGVFNYQDLARGIAHGYAAATTDTGHKAAQRDWMLGPKQRLEEFERIAEHRLAQTSQTLVRQFYGKPAEHRYFLGCSGGGRQALKEMQDYPLDYDGIIAGAPGPQTSEMTTRRMWELLLREHHPGLMSASDWQHVADAATDQCDAQDGLHDGIVADPRSCHFNIDSLRCPAKTAGAFCLSPEQLSLAATIYAPLHDGSGRALDEGILPGVLVDSGRSRLAPAIFGQAVRHRPDWDGQDFDVTRDYDAIRHALPDLDADKPDITRFAAAGGKAILYQGLNDPAVAARMTIGYYDRVANLLGPRSSDTISLFLVPGMGHCAGGKGADRFGGSGSAAPLDDPDHDMLTALDRWVSGGARPERLLASRIEAGRVTQTRPLCAYPLMPAYIGGNPDAAASFVCRVEK